MKPIFEIKPKPGVLERVISRLSIQCHAYETEGGGGIPEFIQTDFAAALAGLSDPIASNLVGTLMGESGPARELESSLDLWAWIQWRKCGRSASITARINARMTRAALTAYVADREWPQKDLIAFVGIGSGRWPALREHYADIRGRLKQAEQDVTRHVSRQLRRFSDASESAGGTETVTERLRRAGF